MLIYQPVRLPAQVASSEYFSIRPIYIYYIFGEPHAFRGCPVAKYNIFSLHTNKDQLSAHVRCEEVSLFSIGTPTEFTF